MKKGKVLLKTEGMCLYPKVKDNAVVYMDRCSISTVKEGEIVVVNTDKGRIGHVFLGTVENNGAKYVVTASLRGVRLDGLNVAEKFEGVITNSYDSIQRFRRIKTEINPLILLMSRGLIGLSYFFCGFLYTVFIVNLAKCEKIISIIFDESNKWIRLWYNFFLKRLR